MVSTITLIYSNVALFLVLSIMTLVILLKYKEKFKADDLINGFIILTNRVVLFILFMTFLVCGVFALVDISNDKIITFLKEVFTGLAYYGFFNYGIFYLVKLINWLIQFFKDNNLFGFSYFSKELKGGKK